MMTAGEFLEQADTTAFGDFTDIAILDDFCSVQLSAQ